MHFRIYLWLSCVVLAGYVRATKEGVSEAPTEAAPAPLQDGLASDRDLFIDDDGSGLRGDESSGSGWGPGPGEDDEDNQGSGDRGFPEDDEDFQTRDKPLPKETTPIETPITHTPYLQTPDPIPETSTVDEDESSPRILSPPDSASERSDIVVPGVEDSRPDQTDITILSGEDNSPAVEVEREGSESRQDHVFIMNAKPEDRATSFFAQPGILAAVIGGAVVGLLCAILVVMFIVYRMRKKDEGSYALDEPKRSPAAASYGKGHANREFYA